MAYRPRGECDFSVLHLPVTRYLGSDQPTSARASQRHNAPVPAGSDVAEQLRQLNCDPIAGTAKLAQDDTVPIMLRARMFAELATCVEPRRKAMELTGTGGIPMDIEISYNWEVLSAEELQTLIAILDKAELLETDEQR